MAKLTGHDATDGLRPDRVTRVTQGNWNNSGGWPPPQGGAPRFGNYQQSGQGANWTQNGGWGAPPQVGQPAQPQPSFPGYPTQQPAQFPAQTPPYQPVSPGYLGAQQPGPWQPTQQPPFGSQPFSPAGQGYYQGGGIYARPPQKKGPSKVVLLAAGALVLLIIAIGFLASSRSDTDPTVDGGYQNEGYTVPQVDSQPPELPYPETERELELWLTDNEVYQKSVGRPVRCEAPQTDPNASLGEQEASLNEFMACLLRVWGPTLEEAGFVAVRPAVTVYAGEINSPCGDLGSYNASYCGVDQQIYVASDVLQILPAALQNQPWMVETVLAHEFGHSVQGRTGILISELILAQEASESGAAELSRRIETQADCLAGLAMGSVGQSLDFAQLTYSAISDMMYEIGDDQLSGEADIIGDHGLGNSRQYWGELGLEDTSVGVCNSFIAPDEQVR